MVVNGKRCHCFAFVLLLNLIHTLYKAVFFPKYIHTQKAVIAKFHQLTSQRVPVKSGGQAHTKVSATAVQVAPLAQRDASHGSA